MPVTVTSKRITGWEKVWANTGKYTARTGEVLEAVAEDIAEDVANEIRESISTPYPPSSSPGEPPHLRTGKLLGGIVAGITRVGSTGAIVAVESTRERPKVPKYLEDGTERMRGPRPYMRPAFEKLRATLMERVKTLMTARLKISKGRGKR